MPEPEGWASDVALPEARDEDPSPGVVEVTLTAAPHTMSIVEGVSTEVWAYNGSMPGPTIRAKVGDTLVVHFINQLPVESTIHWHGVRVPNAMDGTSMTQTPVPPGGSFDYTFPLPDAGTYWYHPHVSSMAQVSRGLYGALVVEGEGEPQLGHELVMVLSDVLLNDDGSINPPEEEPNLEAYFGREGNHLLVNGREAPEIRAVPGVPLRLRLINAATARYFQMRLGDDTFTRLGGDGGFIEHPLKEPAILLATGERADALVTPHGEPGETLDLGWTAYDRGYGTGLQEPRTLLRVALEGRADRPAPIVPSSLRALPRIDTMGAGEDLIQLTESFETGMAVLSINGHPFSETVPIEVMAGSPRILRVENTTKADHAFHLHGFFFQHISAPFVEDKDTINVPAQQTLSLALLPDDRPGGWMFHCHILDHAELGMMGMLMVMSP